MYDTAARAPCDPAGWPATSTPPPVGSSSPAVIRRNVVLPDPLWPMSTIDSWGRTVRSKGASAGRSPYSLVRPSVHSKASVGRLRAGGAALAAATGAGLAFAAGLGGCVGRLDGPVGLGWVRLIVSILASRPGDP